jgi:hypothetical protein
MRDVSGVYQIRNARNGRVYVGASTAAFKRWAGHKFHLRKGRHPNAALQEDWIRCGEAAFTHEVLRVVSPRHLDRAETKAIEAMRRDGASLYNVVREVQTYRRRHMGTVGPQSKICRICRSKFSRNQNYRESETQWQARKTCGIKCRTETNRRRHKEARAGK